MSQTYLHRPPLLDSPYLIWFIAIVLSISVHALLLLQKQAYHMAEPAMVIQETITHVRFASITPPPVKVIEPDVKVSTPTPPQQQADPIIIPKPKPLPKAKPKKQIKKKNTPKPITKKIKVIEKQIKEKTSQVKPSHSTNTKPQVKKLIKTSPIVSEADKRLIEQTRKNYYALLMRHIEAHKHYPRVARRRKIQGKILVTFTLFANGSIKKLMIGGQNNILKKASENAINNALPMPLPPKEMNLPLAVKFHMNYFLK